MLVRVIDEGPAGEVVLDVSSTAFIKLDEAGRLILTQHPGAIDIQEPDNLLYYTVPCDIEVYGRLHSSARTKK